MVDRGGRIAQPGGRPLQAGLCVPHRSGQLPELVGCFWIGNHVPPDVAQPCGESPVDEVFPAGGCARRQDVVVVGRPDRLQGLVDEVAHGHAVIHHVLRSLPVRPPADPHVALALGILLDPLPPGRLNLA